MEETVIPSLGAYFEQRIWRSPGIPHVLKLVWSIQARWTNQVTCSTLLHILSRALVMMALPISVFGA